MAVIASGTGIVGRDEELSQLVSFLDAAGSPRALVVEGEAGIGKTTLWREGLRLARERGCIVLEASGAPAEAQLSFAALGDLLADVLDDVLAALPEPQRRAIAVALLVEDPGPTPPDQRAVALAFLGGLRALASEVRVVVAIDDVQWLDSVSASVLEYAVRRLREERVLFLLAERKSETAGLPLGLERALATDRVASLHVGPLTLGAVHRLLRERLGLVLPRPVLRRVHETAGGNPFYALEIARAIERESVVLAPGQPLPIPQSLGELIRARVAALPPETREVLLVAAALFEPRLGVIEAAVETDVRSALRPAADAQVIALEGDRLRFVHPLLAVAAYGLAEEADRRKAHGRLATAVDEPEERARHLALSAEGPDESIAAALEQAAGHARARGATAAAADLCDQARRLTPPHLAEPIHRRTMAAARNGFMAGDTVRARALLEDAVRSAPSGAARAEALVLLARLLRLEGDQPRAAELSRGALGEAEADERVRAEAAQGLAATLFFMREDLDEALRTATLAADLAERGAGPVVRREALLMKGFLEVLLGRPETDMTRRAADEEIPAPGSDSVLDSPRFYRGYSMIWMDGTAEAVQVLRECYEEAIERGDESALPLILASLAQAEYLSGRWREARRIGEEGYELALQVGQRPQQALLLSTRALVEASLGHEAEARAEAGEALALAGERGMEAARIQSLWALGLLELSLDRPAETARLLGRYRERLLAAGVGEPGSVRFVPDEIEALIGLARLEEAETLLGWLEERGRALDRASALAASWRCRGLLLAVRGEPASALAAFERALAEHERVPMPFERARTLLALGGAKRRAKRKRDARQTLGEALAASERLGAAIWAKRAREELERISGRAPTGGLTPTEQRIAELVAEGRSNKEVAAALFVSPRTVEFHLRNVFRKLDVHTRSELVRRFAAPVG